MQRLAALAALAHGAAAAFISAADPLVLWSGRPNVNADGSVSFDFQSTACSFAVNGLGASVTLIANVTLPAGSAAHLSSFVNDYDSSNLLLAAGTNTYLVAAGLNFNVSNITLHYALEPGMSGADAPLGRFVTFIGFNVSEGASFVPRAPLKRRMDIIGDSITAGSGYDKLESVNGPMSFETGCNPWAPALGNSQAYNWETYLCRYFRANCTTVAWSGGMLLPPWTSSSCQARKYVPQLYTQAWATDAASKWDFSSDSRPDAAIVFLGTNDFACGSGPAWSAAFTAQAVQLVHNITAYYAASPAPAGAAPTQFFMVIGPMSPTAPLAPLQAAIAQANGAGLKASLLDMRNATLDGCGGHPGPIGHWQMALMAKPQIEAVMGW